MAEYTMTVRVPAPDVEKLDRLAERTHRTRADMLRLLIAQASETGDRDIQLVQAVWDDHAE